MALPTAQRHYWIFSADPHHYHWDTLFVKGKEMWHGAAGKQDAVRALKQVRRGDRVLCYHSAPERSLYSIAEVTRDPYPDPHDHTEKNLVADLRAFERLPRQVSLAELRELQKGKLVIAANEFTALYLLPVLAEFRRLHPMIKMAPIARNVM